MEPTIEARILANNELSEDSDKGRKRRKDLQAALIKINREEHGLGIEMNQRYTSTAVHLADQGEMETFESDPLEHYHASTYPGCRLPHVWLSKSVPSKAISTIDLAGKCRFALFTGIGGNGWKSAVERVQKQLGVPIVAHQIGYRQEWEDRYTDWAKIRGVEESGCVLVRPDYFVAWRSPRWTHDSEQELLTVMKKILSL
jgi:hypothetical protein